MTPVTVVTGHVGYQWDRVALLTLPPLQAYCERHGYQLVQAPLTPYAEGRAASWGKVPALIDALYGSQVVVWVDCDILVHPKAPAIHRDVPDGACQALVFHDVPEGDIPNCGVWLMTECMVPVLRQVWDSVDLIDHPWWEQAALMRLLGYDVSAWPIRSEDCRPTVLMDATYALDGRWNAHPYDRRDDLMTHAWFRHATPGSNRDRLALLGEWAREWEAA